MRPARKRKLTLTVDAEVVEKARAVGLNLSEITEKVLRGFAFSPQKGDKAEVYAKYRELLETMKPTVSEYGVSVVIAEYIEDEKSGTLETIRLTPTGELYSDQAGEVFPIKDIEKVPLYLLHQPKQILSNFIGSLSEEKQQRRERIGELEMAKRIILAMNETLAPKRKSTRCGTKT